MHTETQVLPFKKIEALKSFYSGQNFSLACLIQSSYSGGINIDCQMSLTDFKVARCSISSYADAICFEFVRI